jgi:MFS family permease
MARRVGGLRIDDTIVGAAIAAVFGWLTFTPSLFNDGDTSWHLATGRLILDTRFIPHTDPFSFTFAGQPWTAHEWLAEVAMALTYGAAGWAGIAVLFAAAIALTLGLIAREMLRRLPLRYAVLALAALVAVLAPFMLARPHVLTWPILALWLLALMRARDEHRAPRLGWAALMVAWANLHASYLVGLGFAAVFAFEALLQEKDRSAVVTGWGLFGSLSLLCAAITPHGIQGFLYPLQVSGMEALPLIQEWRSSNLADDSLFFAALAAVAVLAFMGRRNLSPVRLALLAGLAVMAVLHARHQPLFAITAALLLPRALGGQGDQSRLLVALVAGIAAIAIARLTIPYERHDDVTYPASAIAHLPGSLRSEPVLNSYSFGGPLILNGIRPYIDGRADMYGDDFTADHHAMILGDTRGFDRVIERFGIRWTILQPGSPLIAKLDRDPQWHRIYADRWAVVHVRR